ncbi:MAG: hypothetical protein PVH25_14735 [Burkholderiales bacterium]
MNRVLPVRSVLSLLLTALLLAGCGKQEADGVYVEISLDNDADIGTYVVFNPNLRTIEECEASIEGALPSIMASAPPAIPKDSKVTGWKCSLDNPGEGKMLKKE